MKKVVLIILLLLYVACSFVNEEKYVIVDIGYNLKDAPYPYVNAHNYLGYSFKNSEKSLKYYSKDECKRTLFNDLKSEKTYILDYETYDIDIYLCINSKLWNSIKSNADILKKEGIYTKGDENISKNIYDFAEKMKVCGIIPFYVQHLPVPETPLICDKYSEENPIPVVESDDFWDIKKEVSQNKQNFDEALREFLKKRK